MAEPKLSELQINIIQSIEHFSKIQQIKYKDEFINEKLGQVAEIRQEFRDFAKKSITHSIKIKIHVEDLIILVKCCTDENFSDDDLLDIFEASLREAKEYMGISKSLKEQIDDIAKELRKIANEAVKRNVKITDGLKALNNKIDNADNRTNTAVSFMKRGLLSVGIGTCAVVAATPFAVPAFAGATVAGVIADLGALTFLGGAATATVSTVAAGASSAHSAFLNCGLKDTDISRSLEEMARCIQAIQINISNWTTYWEKQTESIEKNIKDLFAKTRLNKFTAEVISNRANNIRTESENFIVNVQLALNRDQ